MGNPEAAPALVSEEDGRRALNILTDHVSQQPDSADAQIMMQKIANFTSRSRLKALLDRQMQNTTTDFPLARFEKGKCVSQGLFYMGVLLKARIVLISNRDHIRNS